jgi:hypothetical protein
MTSRSCNGLRLLAVVASLTAALVLLSLAGGRLPGPAVVTAAGPRLRWSGSTDAAGVVIGLIHTFAMAAVAYLLCAGVLEVVARLCSGRTDDPGRCGRRRLWWASTIVRRAAGLGLAVSVAAGTSTSAGASVGQAVVMHLEAPTASPVMHVVTASPIRIGPPATPARSPAPPPTRSPSSIDRRVVWTIRPGDHLWKVARVTLAQASGHPTGDAAILAYVDEIVQANASVFVVSGHPDLVYPGQRFVLPPPPVN